MTAVHRRHGTVRWLVADEIQVLLIPVAPPHRPLVWSSTGTEGPADQLSYHALFLMLISPTNQAKHQRASKATYFHAAKKSITQAPCCSLWLSLLMFLFSENLCCVKAEPYQYRSSQEKQKLPRTWDAPWASGRSSPTAKTSLRPVSN